MAQSTSGATGRSHGILYLVGAAVVFGICSIIQGLGDSSMFSSSYREPDSKILDLLMNVTFYPGWGITALLVILGVKTLIAGD